MTEQKTHYRKAFDSPYLSSADIVEPTTLTIKQVRLEKDKTKKTPDQFNTAYFVESEIRPGEKLKPMILNATNSKTLKTITGSAFLEDWQNVAVTVYVDPSVRFGKESVEGLRISAKVVAKPSPKLVADAKLAAGKGKAEFTAYWKAITASEREMLKPQMETLKSLASQADEQVVEA